MGTRTNPQHQRAWEVAPSTAVRLPNFSAATYPPAAAAPGPRLPAVPAPHSQQLPAAGERRPDGPERIEMETPHCPAVPACQLARLSNPTLSSTCRTSLLAGAAAAAPIQTAMTNSPATAAALAAHLRRIGGGSSRRNCLHHLLLQLAVRIQRVACAGRAGSWSFRMELSGQVRQPEPPRPVAESLETRAHCLLLGPACLSSEPLIEMQKYCLTTTQSQGMSPPASWHTPQACRVTPIRMQHHPSTRARSASAYHSCPTRGCCRAAGPAAPRTLPQPPRRRRQPSPGPRLQGGWQQDGWQQGGWQQGGARAHRMRRAAIGRGDGSRQVHCNLAQGHCRCHITSPPPPPQCSPGVAARVRPSRSRCTPRSYSSSAVCCGCTCTCWYCCGCSWSEGC